MMYRTQRSISALELLKNLITKISDILLLTIFIIIGECGNIRVIFQDFKSFYIFYYKTTDI